MAARTGDGGVLAMIITGMGYLLCRIILPLP
jgi:hypothetical protein